MVILLGGARLFNWIYQLCTFDNHALLATTSFDTAARSPARICIESSKHCRQGSVLLAA